MRSACNFGDVYYWLSNLKHGKDRQYLLSAQIVKKQNGCLSGFEAKGITKTKHLFYLILSGDRLSSYPA